MNRMYCAAGMSALALTMLAVPARAQLTVGTTFSTGAGNIGLAYDPTTDSLWAYRADGILRQFSPTGSALGTIPRPGEGANDADVEITGAPLTLNSTALPAGTLLFINGETAAAEIYALDKSTGAILATLDAQFGNSHVVGGAHHAARGTLFLVQDRVPGGVLGNRVAEISPQTGAVLAEFSVTAALPGFTVNFGDIEIAPNGNVLLVSSDESTIGEFTPEGTFVAEHTLPSGVSSLSGIGFDESRCEVWVASTSASVFRLTGLTGPICSTPCPADFNGDGNLDPDDLSDFITCFFTNASFPGACLEADFNNDANINPDDLSDYITAFFQGC